MTRKDTILITLIIIAVVASIGLFAVKEIAKRHRLDLEEQLWQEKVSKNKVNSELSSLDKQMDGLQITLAKRREDIQSLETELITHKREIEAKSTELEKFDSNTSSMRAKFKQATSSIEELKKRLANIITDTLKLRNELDLLHKANLALQENLDQHVEEEQLPDSEEVQAEDELPEPRLTGEVLTVNREFSFIVISLGQDQGIEQGMVLDIARDAKGLGKAEVETVRENISAAALLNKEDIAKIRAGDEALFY